MYSQEERKFFAGVNVGVKFANKNYALRYNGVYEQQLYQTLIQNPNNYDQIFRMLGDQHFLLPNDAYPANIRYTPGLLTGVTVGYKLSPNIQASIDANFNKLKVRDVFSIEVLDATNTTSQNQYELGELYAEESRFNGRFNIDYIIPQEKIKYIIGVSGLFTAWRIDQHVAVFQGFQMPLFSVHNPNNNFSTRVSGSGWGGGLNLGIEYRVNEKIVAQLVYQPYFSRVDYFNTKNEIQSLGGAYVPDKFRLENDLTLRFLWK